MNTFVPFPGSVEKYAKHRTIANELMDGRKAVRHSFWYYVKQLVPLTYWTAYNAPGGRRLVIWKSWFGREKILLDTRIAHCW